MDARKFSQMPAVIHPPTKSKYISGSKYNRTLQPIASNTEAIINHKTTKPKMITQAQHLAEIAETTSRENSKLRSTVERLEGALADSRRRETILERKLVDHEVMRSDASDGHDDELISLSDMHKLELQQRDAIHALEITNTNSIHSTYTEALLAQQHKQAGQIAELTLCKLALLSGAFRPIGSDPPREHTEPAVGRSIASSYSLTPEFRLHQSQPDEEEVAGMALSCASDAGAHPRDSSGSSRPKSERGGTDSAEVLNEPELALEPEPSHGLVATPQPTAVAANVGVNGFTPVAAVEEVLEEEEDAWELPTPGYRPSTVHNWNPNCQGLTGTPVASKYDPANGSGTRTRGDLYPHGLSQSKRGKMIRGEDNPACKACSVQ